MSATAWGAVRAVGAHELRRRWKGIVAVGLLAGLVGGVVLGALVAARRSATAYDRLRTAGHADDVRVLAFGAGDHRADVLAFPSVEEVWAPQYAVGQLEGPGVMYLGMTTGPTPPPGLFTPVVIEGRMYEDGADDEVVLTETAAHALRLHPGAPITLRMLTPEEVAQFDTGFGDPDGPRLALRVVGVVRMPPGPDDRSPLIAGPAFAARHAATVGVGQTLFVRLRPGAGSLASFQRDLAELGRRVAPRGPGAEEFGAFQATPTSDGRQAVDATARVLVGGLLVLMLVAGLAGAVVVAQALARRHGAAAADRTAETALGLTTGERVMARFLPGLLGAAVAGLVAAGLGLAAGVIEPLGGLRRLEPRPGWAPNAGVLALGGVAVAAAVAAMTAGAAWFVARTPSRARRRAHPLRVIGLGRRPAPALGARFAVDPGRSGSSAARSALVGVAVGMAGMVAAITFGSSVTRLVHDPVRWGWQGDLAVVDIKEPMLIDLVRDPRAAAVTFVESAMVRIDGRDLSGYGLERHKGDAGWTLLAGREPAAANEVVLTARLATSAGVTVGGTVTAETTAEAGGQHRRLLVTGLGIGPLLNGERPGDAALLTRDGLRQLQSTQAFHEALVRLAPGPGGDELRRQLTGVAELSEATRPPDVDNLAQLGVLPSVLGGVLAAVALVALAHALVVTVRRRTRDLGVMRAVGFTPSQSGAVVMVTAMVTVVAGLLIGIPLGLGVGRVVWWAVARAVGVRTDLSIPVGWLVLTAGAAVVTALVAAAWPARRAVGLRPAGVLRYE